MSRLAASARPAAGGDRECSLAMAIQLTVAAPAPPHRANSAARCSPDDCMALAALERSGGRRARMELPFDASDKAKRPIRNLCDSAPP